MTYIERLIESRKLTECFSEKELQSIIEAELFMEVDTNIQIESVILSDENKEKLRQFMEEQKNIDKFSAHGLKPINRLLFYGASGTGKTYLAKALSNYLGYTILYIDIAKSLSEATVANNISLIFKVANKIGKCVLFLDECDSIAWNRDSSNTDSGTIRRATNSIFQNLDQMNSSNIFISATNMLHRLDLAFERRFDMKLEFKRPEDLDHAIRKFAFSEFSLVDDVDATIKSIVQDRIRTSAKLSYDEIRTIVERNMKKALIHDKMEMSTAEIYKDLAIAERIRIIYIPEDASERDRKLLDEINNKVAETRTSGSSIL